MFRLKRVLCLLALSAALSPAAQRPRFLYVAGDGGTVTGYTIDAHNGALTLIGSASSGTSGAHAIAADPLGRFLFVAFFGLTHSSVAAFQIAPVKGDLTPSPGSPYQLTGLGARAIAVDPTGQFVYVGDNSTNQVEALQIDPGSGALTLIGSQPTGSQPTGLAVHPSGQFAYVVNSGTSDVSTYSIDSVSGALTSAGPNVPAGNGGPVVMAVHPSGQYAYVLNEGTGVFSFAVDPTTGLLSPIGASVSAGSDAGGLAVDPVGPYLYALEAPSQRLWAYGIQNDGTLMTIGSYTAALSGFSVIVDPTGRFLWATNGNVNKVAAFGIQADGSLASLGPMISVPGGASWLTTSVGPKSNWDSASPMNTARGELAAATGPDGLIYAAGGRFVCGTDQTLQAYDEVADAWTTVGSSALLHTGLAAATGADGRIYTFGGYISCYPDLVSADVQAYDTGAGAWSPLSSMPTPRGSLAAAAAPNGKIYVIGGATTGSNPFLNVVEVYDPVSDSWSTASPLPLGRAFHAAVTGADGKIYVIGGTDSTGAITNSVLCYDPGSDTWSNVAPMPTARTGLAATLGPDGKIYTIGGETAFNVYGNNVEAYDPVANAWTTLEVMPTARAFLAAATGPDGRIFAIGGISGPDFLNTVEVYTIPQP